MSGEVLVSLDIDGTMEFGEPPGPVTVAIVRRLLAAGIVVGSASDRTRGDQEDCWRACGVGVAFVGGKHHLDDVRARFSATRYVHVGDTHVDEHYAGLHGFEFVSVDDPAVAVEVLIALATAGSRPAEHHLLSLNVPRSPSVVGSADRKRIRDRIE